MEKLLLKLEELVMNKRFKEVVELIEKNQKDLFDYDPINSCEIHLLSLIELKRYDEARLKLQEYRNYPYKNMEVEEYMMDMEKRLQTLINKSISNEMKERNIDENGVDFSKFRSQNQKDLMVFLTQIYDSKKFDLYEDEIKSILKRNVSDDVNYLCVNMLYVIDSSLLVDFKYKNSEYHVDFKNFIPPFSKDDKGFHAIISYLNTNLKNVTVQKLAKDILARLSIEIFPKVIDEQDKEFIIEAVVYSAKKLLGENHIYMSNEKTDKYIEMIGKIIG